MNILDGMDSVMKDNLILMAPTGSHAYGTNMDDSDEDYKGVCIPPLEYYIGLDTFKEYNSTTNKDGKNTKDDVDVSVLSINNFVMHCMKGTPNVLEMLFLEDEQYILMTNLGKELRRNRDLFLTKNLRNSFGGYAKGQSKRMKYSEDNRGLGFNTKMFAHSVRLYECVIEILRDGTFSTYRNNGEYLKELRKGCLELHEAEEKLKYLEDQVDREYDLTSLPKKVDYKQVNNLLQELNRKGLGI